jgi:hypothetical protein
MQIYISLAPLLRPSAVQLPPRHLITTKVYTYVPVAALVHPEALYWYQAWNLAEQTPHPQNRGQKDDTPLGPLPVMMMMVT